MSLRNTKTEYGSVTKAFHWAIAALIITLLIMGLVMDEIPNTNPQLKFAVFNLHKSLGITVLILALGRIVWHFISRRPDPADTLKPLDRIGASVMHYFLYVLMVLMPLSGWAMSSAFGRTVHLFGLVALPDFVGKDEATAKILAERHEQIGYTLMAAAALHAAAALKHHFINKDNVMKRMLPLLLLAAFALTSTTASAAQAWNVLHDKSSITFKPKQMGTEFTGAFDTFSADIAFDPNDLAGSKVSVVIQTGSGHTGDSERDQNLKSKQLFDVAAFPEAKFEAAKFTKTGDNAFTAEGTLTIKGIAVPVSLPFTLKIAKNEQGIEEATVDGSVTLDRSKFQLGTEQWTDPSIIANDVPVDIHIVALARGK